MPDDVFWSLTPKLFGRLCNQFRQRERRADRRSGEIVSMLYNLKRDTTKDPRGWTWEDVYPTAETQAEPQTDEQMMMTMNAWAGRTRQAN